MMTRDRLLLSALAWAVCAVAMIMSPAAHAQTYTINSDSTYTNAGTLDIGPGQPSGITTLIIDSGGLLRNLDTLYNYGTLNNNAGALNNTLRGTLLYNAGTMTNTDSVLINANTLINAGTMTNTGSAFVNGGTFTNNAGAITTNNAGSVDNAALTAITNDLGFPFSFSGGWLYNGGVLNGVTYAGTLTNNGMINGTGDFLQVAGETTNNGTFSQASVTIQSGTFNQQGGSLNAPSITNSGTFTYTGGSITGNILNNAPGTFAITPAGPSTLTINGTVTNNSPATGIGQSGFPVNGGSVTFAGDVTNNGGGMFVDASGNHYGGFSVNQATVAFTTTFTNNVNATFTVNQSTVTFGTFVNNGIFYTDPSTIIFDGNFTNTGTVTTSPGDIFEFLGIGTQILSLGSADLTLASLIIGPNDVLDITGSGAVTVGNSTFSSGYYTENSSGNIVPYTVPEPTILWFLCPTLAGLAAMRRRYRRRN